MTWGLRRLTDEFGHNGVPKTTWQIDMFGHTREHAAMFAEMGFEGHFFPRYDYQEKQTREKAKTLENIWSGSDDLGKRASIFTHMMDHMYNAPEGFCFDPVWCGDEPIIDDPESEDYNADLVAQR